MNGQLNRYMNLSISEINELIKKNDEILDKIWKEDDGSSWDNYCKKCQPYWDDNKLLRTAASMNANIKEIKMRPLEDWEKDNKWVHIDIETFIDWCKHDAVTSYDGCGVYATKTEASNLYVSCWGIKNGFVRKDFTHVCWYNK